MVSGRCKDDGIKQMYFALLLVILFLPEHSCSDLSTCSLQVDRLLVKNPTTFGVIFGCKIQ